MYLSFEGDKAVVTLRAKGQTLDDMIADAQDRLLDALDALPRDNFRRGRPEAACAARARIDRLPARIRRGRRPEGEAMTDGAGAARLRRRDPLDARDAEARRLAVDPRRNVALEASAGTGKTRVLVDRYIALLARRRQAAQHPRHHVHAQGGGRDAAAHPAGARPARSASRRIAPELWREIRESLATSRSRRSTRSASRCCASFRSRPTSIPASTSPTKPKRHGWSTRRSNARFALGRGAGRRRTGDGAALRRARRVPAARRA